MPPIDPWTLIIRAIYTWWWTPWALVVMLTIQVIRVVQPVEASPLYHVTLGLLLLWAISRIVALRRHHRQEPYCPTCGYDQVDCLIRAKRWRPHGRR